MPNSKSTDGARFSINKLPRFVDPDNHKCISITRSTYKGSHFSMKVFSLRLSNQMTIVCLLWMSLGVGIKSYANNSVLVQRKCDYILRGRPQC